ncbi:hypothetical protein LIER_02771 [Lithospermum erythrorhizon]|uniref:Uncharacterized protein n=1 Tax=Lithospermum erythrorhizon TaxID=34254 RepID=A0AAV3NQP1_LITER
MANVVSQSKRQREEENILEKVDFQDSKHHKTCNQIIPSLDEDVEEFNPENFSEIFTILQEELSTSDSNFNNFVASPNSHQEHKTSACDSIQTSKDDEKEDDDKYDNVMKHLLEASDDELGLPNVEENGDAEINGRDFPFPLNLGWWEFEDEAANYYAMMQPEFLL